MPMRAFILIFFCSISHIILAQPVIRQGETIVCEVDSVALNKLHVNKRIRTHSRTSDEESIFDVKYSGFTEEAKAAFQFAVDIWSKTIKSDVQIRVFANWAFLDNTSTLAFVTPTEVKNFPNAPSSTTWYPIALAEKIARADINAVTEADIVATFNSRREDWYFGTDGNCPTNKLDLVTVVLHELGHGLGISGTFRINNSNGFYGLNDGNFKIYDSHLRNGVNIPLLDFTNGTVELANQLTGNSLVFSSPIARLLSSTTANPRVYAPSPYNPGSSISHLDQSTYSNTRNSLMTPFAEQGKVAHDSGPIVRGMLYEMGWLYTWHDHIPIGDQENLFGKKFKLKINGDTTLLSGSVKLVYSYNSFSTSSEAQMQTLDQQNFEVEIPNPLNETEIYYYFESQDVFGRKTRNPTSPTSFYNFYHGIDIIKPSITHTVPEDIIQFEPRLDIAAIVNDNIGIASVHLSYQVNNGEIIVSPMTSSDGLNYSFMLNLTSLALQQGDQIRYFITAVDASSQANVTRFPASGNATIDVLTFEIKDIYTSNLNSNSKEFYGDFNILKPVGFLDGAIHSPHPYPKPESELLDISYVLLFPIRIKDEDSYLNFDEVVLVEPGIGNDHTSDTFGDYVIVEGSNDDGQTWIPLEAGYDSRKFPEWLNYYNSDLRNGDSRAVGTLNYFKHHKIDLLNTFDQGDIINIRFRLHSNSQNTGWGWAIDNLIIQDEILSVNSFAEEVVIFPNPIIDKFRLKSMDNVQVSVYSALGRTEMDRMQIINGEYDLSSLNSGVYFVKIVSNEGKITFVRIMKK